MKFLDAILFRKKWSIETYYCGCWLSVGFKNGPGRLWHRLPWGFHGLSYFDATMISAGLSHYVKGFKFRVKYKKR